MGAFRCGPETHSHWGLRLKGQDVVNTFIPTVRFYRFKMKRCISQIAKKVFLIEIVLSKHDILKNENIRFVFNICLILQR